MTDRFVSKRHNRLLNLLCQQCDKRFTNDRFKLFCSHECKVEYYRSIGRHLWTKEEEDLISDLIGQYPTAAIVRRVKRQIKDVSANRIKMKVEELAREQNVYISDRVENCSIAEWARILSVGELRIHRWLKKGLKSRRSGKEHMITYSSMRRYASEHPSDFHSIPRDNLKRLFSEPSHDKYVNAILAAKPSKAPVRPVQCLNTGKVYPSLTSAEKELAVSRDTIKRAIASGLAVKRDSQYLRFQWAD